MAELKYVHFGHFLRWRQVKLGMDLKELAAKVGRTGRWIGQIQVTAEDPDDVSDVMLGKLAKALDMTPDDLKRLSRKTAVAVPRFKETGRRKSRKPNAASRSNADR